MQFVSDWLLILESFGSRIIMSLTKRGLEIPTLSHPQVNGNINHRSAVLGDGAGFKLSR